MTPGKGLALFISFFTFIVPSFYFLSRCSSQFSDFSFLKLIFAPIVLRLLASTLFYAGGSFLIIAGLGLFLSAVLHFTFMKWRKLRRPFEFILSAIWSFPSLFFVMLTWKVLRTLGLADWVYSMKAVVLAWIFGITPFLILGLLKILADFDIRETEAAYSIGASKIQIWMRLYWPRLKAAFFKFSIQVFWLLLTSFSVVVILGGGTPNDTLETAIYQSVRFYELHMDRAFAFGFWQAVMIGLLFYFQKKQKNEIGTEWALIPTEIPSKRYLLFIIPFIVLLSGYFLSSIIWEELMRPWFQMVSLAVAVTLLTFFLSVLYYRSWKWLAEVGALVSPMMFALMWFEAYGFSDYPLFLCIGVQVVLFLPWVSRTLFPLYDRIRIQEIEAAKSLGASSIRAWITIEWPRVRPDVLRTASWVMALSMAEVSSVILFSKSEFEPLSVWSQNQFSRFRFEEGFDGVKLIIFTSILVMGLAFLPAVSRRSKE